MTQDRDDIDSGRGATGGESQGPASNETGRQAAGDRPEAAPLASRLLRPVAIGLAVVAAAAAVIMWLPLDSGVETDVKAALVGYETAREAAWPAASPITVPLPQAQQAALADRLERALSAYAAGEALARFDADGVVGSFAEAAMADRPWVVTQWDGEVVYFDFVRQTLRGDVIVRAGVRRAHQVGRMSELRERIVARRWVRADGADIYEYRLRSIDGAWKVVDVQRWGVYGPQGNAVESVRER